MPIYRQDDSGRFLPFEKTPYPDLEKNLEGWIESNPYLLLENEPLAIIGRQVSTRAGKIADLLGVDESGACVVIELKRGMAPRDVIGQVLEYTAWVDSLTIEDLSSVARQYGTSKGLEAAGIWDLYRDSFEQGSEDAEEFDVEQRVTFNARQRMVIVAEAFPPEMEETLRYLRSKLGVDISAVRFGLHQSGNDTLLETEIVVGRESPASASDKAAPRKGPDSHQAIREKLEAEFVRRAVDGLDDWLESLGVPGLEVRHNQGTAHSLYLHGRMVAGWYFRVKSPNHVYFWLKEHRPEDEQLRQLSNPAMVRLEEGDDVGGTIANESDMAIFQTVVKARLSASDS